MKITFNGTEFIEVTAIIEGERIEGVMCHDLKDENRDGDAVCTNSVKLPEDADQAVDMLQGEYWESDCSVMDTVEITAETERIKSEMDIFKLDHAENIYTYN